mmetsp:Transcript_8154/g.15502  ORF Transcript_8154/g.15502 Transcript_8154/m.15502 type:complete len:231 (-) Transcript_8154:2014-2706(-)
MGRGGGAAAGGGDEAERRRRRGQVAGAGAAVCGNGGGHALLHSRRRPAASGDAPARREARRPGGHPCSQHLRIAQAELGPRADSRGLVRGEGGDEAVPWAGQRGRQDTQGLAVILVLPRGWQHGRGVQSGEANQEPGRVGEHGAHVHQDQAAGCGGVLPGQHGAHRGGAGDTRGGGVQGGGRPSGHRGRAPRSHLGRAQAVCWVRAVRLAEQAVPSMRGVGQGAGSGGTA